MTSYLQAVIVWLASTCRLYGPGSSYDPCRKDAASLPRSPVDRTATAKRPSRHARRSLNASTSSTASTASSFTPVILIPGVVNTPLMLIPPELPVNATLRRRTRTSSRNASESSVTKLQTFSRRSLDSVDSDSSLGSSSQDREDGTIFRRPPYAISDEHESFPVVKLR